MRVTHTVMHKAKRGILLFGLTIALGHGWITRDEYEVTRDADT